MSWRKNEHHYLINNLGWSVKIGLIQEDEPGSILVGSDIDWSELYVRDMNWLPITGSCIEIA